MSANITKNAITQPIAQVATNTPQANTDGNVVMKREGGKDAKSTIQEAIAIKTKQLGFPPKSKDITFIVSSGDTLLDLAKWLGGGDKDKAKVIFQQILKANPRFDSKMLNNKLEHVKADPDSIYPGDSIKVPSAVASDAMGVKEAVPAIVDKVEKTTTNSGKEVDKNQLKRQNPLEKPGNTQKTTTSEEAVNKEKTTEKKAKESAKKLSNNSAYLHGALAIAAAIPGIGAVAAGIGAVIKIADFVTNWMNNEEPSWKDLGGALLYATAAVVPGFGAFGGLWSMMTSDTNSPVSAMLSFSGGAKDDKKKAGDEPETSPTGKNVLDDPASIPEGKELEKKKQTQVENRSGSRQQQNTGVKFDGQGNPIES
ncbi:hypothetical protein KAI87_02615 [Myxococcota bacterium]|nr:hypothetical protein [Myxococcota bacterium]